MLRTPEQVAADYTEFRGHCKELCEAAVQADPTLAIVRGHYFCPLWSTNEPHWWTVRQDGTIHDPSARQFPSGGFGIYTPFNGMIECSNCGKEVPEEEASLDSNYAFCSYRCHGQFVGAF